jgi:DNA primase
MRSHQELGIEESDPAGDLERAVSDLRGRTPTVLPAGAGATDEERRLALEALNRLRAQARHRPSRSS